MKNYSIKVCSYAHLAEFYRSAFRGCYHPIIQLKNIGLRPIMYCGNPAMRGASRVAYRDSDIAYFRVTKRGFRFVI